MAHKTIILTLLFLIVFAAAYSQDITRTDVGYEIDYPHLYVRVDTLHNMSYIYNYYGTKMYMSLNGAKAQIIKPKQVFTVWALHFTATVSHKRYRRIYTF